LGWLKISGPEQNILGPVKGQGISTLSERNAQEFHILDVSNQIFMIFDPSLPLLLSATICIPAKYIWKLFFYMVG
jgi:hypothetical protein